MDRTPVNALNASVSSESIEVPEYHPLTECLPRSSGSASHCKCIHYADHQHRPVDREATLNGIHGVRARCRRQNGLRTAQPHECCRRVLSRAVDVVLGAKLVGERCLVLSTIDGNGFEAELGGELHPKMAEAPKPQYRCGLTGPDTAVAQRVERGNAGTHQRGSVYRG